MTPKILLLMLWIIFLTRFNVNGQKSREAESAEKARLPPPPPPKASKAASRERAMVPLVPPTEIPVAFTTTPSSVPTSASGPLCPCVKKPGSDSCIVYDQNFQAATVEEAIVNFPDLTMRKLGTDGSDIKKTIISNSIMSSKGGTDGNKVESATDAPLLTTTLNPNDLCQTEECKACSNVLMPQLVAIGLLNSTESEVIRKKLGVSNNVTDCTKYNALHAQKTHSGSTKVRSRRPTTKNYSSSTLTFTTETVPLTNLDYINNLTVNGLSYWNLTHAGVDANMEVPQRPELRLKRQLNLNINATIGGTSSIGAKAGVKIVGERFKIACIKRGEPLEKNSEWVSLCDACWVWRKLPVEYFPPYINELICDSDQKCLSGWGTCQQQYRNVDILKNLNTNGKDDWQAVTLESSNYCECAVKTGSALHNFVTA